MKKITFLFSLFVNLSLAQSPIGHYVKIETNLGACFAKLYNATPQHRDNFLKLTKDKFFDNLLFHRVIKNFMVQGGDPNSKNASDGQMLGMGSLGYRIPFEFQDSLMHKKGALAGARDGNPQKASNASQFYIVHGQVFSEEHLTLIEQQTGKHFNAQQRKIYSTIGGAPFLDGDYTVFGEVVKGLDVIDKIASVDKNANDRPLVNISMTISELTPKQALHLEWELGIQKPTFFQRLFCK